MDYLIEFDYDADETDELSVKKGDIVSKVRSYEDGWMIGVLRGKEGVFPSNFGKFLKEEKTKSQEDDIVHEDGKSNNSNNTNNSNLSEDDVPTEQARSQKKVTGVGFGNIFSGGKIQLKHTNKDANHKDAKSKTTIEEAKLDASLEKKPSREKETARVLHNYTAENPDELSLVEGDIITVLDKDNEDDGWWKGKLSTGQIGVFPDNFVELIKTAPEEATKPVRPVITGQTTKGPPPLLAAKPNVALTKNIPPRPPQLSDSKNAATKPTSRNLSVDKQDGISFETPLNHKPLVGPNAGRAKRPGKKLPTNVNMTGINNEEDKDVISPKSNIKENSSTVEKNHDMTTSKPMPKETPIATETASDIVLTRPKNRETPPPVEKTPEISTAKPSKFRESAIIPSVEDNVEKVPDFSFRPKSILENSVDPKPVTISKARSVLHSEPNSKKTGDLNDEISLLSRKVFNLQQENTELHNDISDLRKSSTDQMNLLKNKLNKLINDFDEEKAKRTAADITITRLKENIDDLEHAMMSRDHKK